MANHTDDQCFLSLLPYVDKRPVFLAAIGRFLWNASRAELAEIKKGVKKRETKLRPKEAISAQRRGQEGEAVKLLVARREGILRPVTRRDGTRNRAKRVKLDEKVRRELAEIESLIQAGAVRQTKPGRMRGRPRAEENGEWIAGAFAVLLGRSVHGWTWRRATIASELTPTKPNIRTVIRRQKQLERLIRKGMRLPVESV